MPQLEPELNPKFLKPVSFHQLHDGMYFCVDDSATVWIKLDELTAVGTEGDAGAKLEIKLNPARKVYPLRDQSGPKKVEPKPSVSMLVGLPIDPVEHNLLTLALHVLEVDMHRKNPGVLEAIKSIELASGAVINTHRIESLRKRLGG